MTVIYTQDEARDAFIRSTTTLLATIDASEHRLSRLITGRGSHKAIAQHQRSLIYRHWALLADLQAAGHGWAIDNEIEGILSCIELDGTKGAAHTIEGMLSDPEDINAKAA